MKWALWIRRAARLRLDAIHFLRLEKDIARAVDQHAHAELVDGRHLDRRRLGHLNAGESSGRGSHCETRGHFQSIASIEVGHDFLRWLETKRSVNLQSGNYSSDYQSCQSKWSVAGGYEQLRTSMGG